MLAMLNLTLTGALFSGGGETKNKKIFLVLSNWAKSQHTGTVSKYL